MYDMKTCVKTLEMYNAGATLSDISATLNIPCGSIYAVMDRATRKTKSVAVSKKAQTEKKIYKDSDALAIDCRERFGAHRFDAIMIDMMDGVSDYDILRWYKQWGVDKTDLTKYRIMFQAITKTPRRLRAYLDVLPEDALERRREKRESCIIHQSGDSDRDGGDEPALRRPASRAEGAET